MYGGDIIKEAPKYRIRGAPVGGGGGGLIHLLGLDCRFPTSNCVLCFAWWRGYYGSEPEEAISIMFGRLARMRPYYCTRYHAMVEAGDKT